MGEWFACVLVSSVHHDSTLLPNNANAFTSQTLLRKSNTSTLKPLRKKTKLNSILEPSVPLTSSHLATHDEQINTIAATTSSTSTQTSPRSIHPLVQHHMKLKSTAPLGQYPSDELNRVHVQPLSSERAHVLPLTIHPGRGLLQQILPFDATPSKVNNLLRRHHGPTPQAMHHYHSSKKRFRTTVRILPPRHGSIDSLIEISFSELPSDERHFVSQCIDRVRTKQKNVMGVLWTENPFLKRSPVLFDLSSILHEFYTQPINSMFVEDKAQSKMTSTRACDTFSLISSEHEQLIQTLYLLSELHLSSRSHFSKCIGQRIDGDRDVSCSILGCNVHGSHMGMSVPHTMPLSLSRQAKQTLPTIHGEETLTSHVDEQRNQKIPIHLERSREARVNKRSKQKGHLEMNRWNDNQMQARTQTRGESIQKQLRLKALLVFESFSVCMTALNLSFVSIWRYSTDKSSNTHQQTRDITRNNRTDMESTEPPGQLPSARRERTFDREKFEEANGESTILKGRPFFRWWRTSEAITSRSCVHQRLSSPPTRTEWYCCQILWWSSTSTINDQRFSSTYGCGKVRLRTIDRDVSANNGSASCKLPACGQCQWRFWFCRDQSIERKKWRDAR